MKFFLALAATVASLACIAPRQAAAEVKAEVVHRAKRATALVVQPRGFATAFCIDPDGYFLTNQHAVARADNGSVQIVLGAGEKDEQKLEARVVRVDAENDLALLKVSAKGDLVTLSLAEQADEADLVETQTVMVVGYPFGDALRTKEQTYPNVSVNIGRVSSLRRSNGRLETIQTDAEVNPGNSGGPMLNEAGEVIGIVQAKVRFTGVNFAIPASYARKMLATPEISFELPPIAYDRRYEEQTFTARVVTFDGERRDFDVTLKIDGGEPQREIALKRQGEGVYTAKATIFKKRDGARLPVAIAFGGGTVRGEIDDLPIDAGEAGERMSEIRRIERRDDMWVIHGRNDKAATQKNLKLKKLAVHLGETTLELPLADIQSITISQPPPDKGAVNYKITASEDGKQVSSLAGQILITGAPLADVPKDGLPAADGEFTALDGSAPWPDYLEAPPISVSKDGLKGLGRNYVRTKSGRFMEADFTFELIFTMAKDDPIAFIGLGEGRGKRSYNEPQNSVNFRIHSQQQSEGWVAISKAGPSDNISVGTAGPGTHRAILRKKGDQVTFAIDVDNDGESSDDIQHIFPRFSEFAPFLHEKNTYIFFGDGGTYQQAKLVIDSEKEEP